MGGPQDPLSVPASIFSGEMYDLMNFFSTYINIMLQSQLLCKTDLRVHSLQKQLFLKCRQRGTETVLSIAFPVPVFVMKIS